MKSKKQLILLSLAISILLMLMKFGAFFITHSNAILTDAAESIVNVIATSFAFYSIYLSSLPKDSNHPYGHGKIEFFSAFLEGSLIIIAGIIIFAKAVYNIFYPQEISDLLEGAFLIGITGLVNGALGWFLIREGKNHNSITITADGKHLYTDAISSFGLVLGLILIYFTHLLWLDSLISGLLSLYIIKNGYQLTRTSVGGLMDESDTATIKKLIAVLKKNRKAEWIDIHNLRTQRYGDAVHIDCHITLPYYFDLNRVYKEVSEIDMLINKNIPNTEIFAHTDPCISKCCHYCSMPNCAVRQEKQIKTITWTVENVTHSHKHFNQN